MATAAELAEKFPFLAFLAKDPEIGPLLNRAVDPNAGFSEQKFRAEVMKTGWWRRNSETDRAWLIKKATDPGQAKQELNTAWSNVQHLAQVKFGAKLPSSVASWLSDWMARTGIPPDDPRVVAKISHYAPWSRTEGEEGINRHQVKALAEGAWFSGMTDKRAAQIARQITLGRMSIENVNVRLAEQARSRYPWLAERIAAGETLADISEGHRMLVAEELEISPGKINVHTNPTWRKLLGVKDAKTGKMRTPTDNEVIRLARDRAEWWANSSKGRQADAGWAAAMLKTFGARA